MGRGAGAGEPGAASARAPQLERDEHWSFVRFRGHLLTVIEGAAGWDVCDEGGPLGGERGYREREQAERSALFLIKDPSDEWLESAPPARPTPELVAALKRGERQEPKGDRSPGARA